jgi:hypothetical protein
MSSLSPPSLLRVPILTEVVSLADMPPDLDLPTLLADPVPLGSTTVPAGVPARTAAASAPPPPAPDPAWLVETVLREVEQRIGALIEQRLREALAPTLARAAETLVAESRTALEAGLREVVQESVAATLARHTGQPGDIPPR